MLYVNDYAQPITIIIIVMHIDRIDRPHTHTHARTHARTHTHIPTHTHTHTPPPTHTHTLASTQAHTSTLMNVSYFEEMRTLNFMSVFL